MTATNKEMVELFLGIAAGEISRDQVKQLFGQWVVITN
jgi:hypothetical protein